MKQVHSKFNIFNITILILSLLSLQYEYFIIDEFKIETIYWLGLSLLLALNIYKLLIESSKSNIWIRFVLNGLLIAITCFNFPILTLTLFGYGFSGKSIQVIWFISFILNTALFITAAYNIVYKMRILAKNQQFKPNTK